MHEAVFGMTGSGKSYYAWQELLEVGSGIYCSLQDTEDTPKECVKADRRDGATNILRAARKAVVHYEAHTDPVVAAAELDVLAAEALQEGGVRIVIDEAHLFCPEGQQRGGAFEIARRGRKHQVWGTYVTPRPQDLSKAIVAQCRRVTVFRLAWAREYLRRHGLPEEEIQAALEKGGEHSYVQIVDGRMIGPMSE